MLDRAKVSVLVIRRDEQICVNLRQHKDDGPYEELPIGVFQQHFLGYIAAFAAATRLCEEYGVDEPEQMGFAG